jgi:glycine/D-amino acid oxidase-like deaminating enzyme
MDLTAGYPFYLIKNGLIANYPKLEKSIKTGVVVIGGGISGSLTAYYLTKAGFECVVVDSRNIGMGSTCASTSLLQYELDMPLSMLSQQIGYQKAARTYRLCSESIDILQTISTETGNSLFEKQQSLYFAAYKKDRSFLLREHEFRKRAGFDVRFLESQDVLKNFGFQTEAAILSEQGATTDAYRLTHGC